MPSMAAWRSAAVIIQQRTRAGNKACTQRHSEDGGMTEVQVIEVHQGAVVLGGGCEGGFEFPLEGLELE